MQIFENFDPGIGFLDPKLVQIDVKNVKIGQKMADIEKLKRVKNGYSNENFEIFLANKIVIF